MQKKTIVGGTQNLSRRQSNGIGEVLNNTECSGAALDMISKLHEEVQLLQAELVKTRQGLAQREILLRNSAETT